MSGLAQDWQQMLIVLSVASMAGNIAAIAQSNLKRMLAYSTIGQIGFMLLGLTPTVVSVNTLSAANGYSSSMFYVLSYVFTTLGTFGIVMLLARAGHEAEQVDDLAGLAAQPWYAGGDGDLHVLAGRHPADGGLLRQAGGAAGHRGRPTSSLYIWLAMIAVLLSLVAAFYYLRVVKVMYFDEPADTAPDRQHRRQVRCILAQRRGDPGVRPAARRPDGDVRAGDRQGAELLTLGARGPARRRRRQHLREQTVSRETVSAAGELLEVRRDRIRLPDGGEATREFIVHPAR